MVVRDQHVQQVSIFYRGERGVDGTRLVDFVEILVDVCLSQDHTRSAQVMDSPVETGADISDHLRQDPDVLTMHGIVTDTPVEVVDLSRYNGVNFETPEALESALRDVATTLQAPRSRDAYQQLEEARLSGQLMRIVTDLRVYQNMAMTSLSVHEDADTGRALDFTVSFREVRFADSKLVTIEHTATKSAHSEKKVGAKPTKEASKERLKSLAADGVDYAAPNQTILPAPAP